MARRRPSIKGKGADFFFESAPQTSAQVKVTFYLPKELVDKLDEVWLDLRRTYKKLRKSDIARIALEEILSDYEGKQQNSKLLKHLNVKTS